MSCDDFLHFSDKETRLERSHNLLRTIQGASERIWFHTQAVKDQRLVEKPSPDCCVHCEKGRRCSGQRKCPSVSSVCLQLWSPPSAMFLSAPQEANPEKNSVWTNSNMDAWSGVKKENAILHRMRKESWKWIGNRYWREITENSNPATSPLMKFRLYTMLLVWSGSSSETLIAHSNP